MIGIISLMIVVTMSLLVTRVASLMLSVTGMSRESARFQARSAFSGVGFTTAESEAVVNHPVRRRIVMALILLGNAGVITVLGTLVISFSSVDGSRQALGRLGLLALGMIVLWLVSMSRVADRAITRVVEWALTRFTDLDTRDYVGLLRLADDWVVGELEVDEQDWICDVPLEQLALREEGVAVLGIERRDGRWVGAPTGEAAFRPGDVAVLYGRQAALDRIDRRTHDEAGEMDRIAALIDFTEEYLEQQEGERSSESAEAETRTTPTLAVGEEPPHRPEEPLDRPEESSASPEPAEPS